MAGGRKTTGKSSAPKGSAYDQITARILAELEKGKVPWQQPWAGGGWPRNLDGKSYRGINVLLLLTSGYAASQWGTFKAVNDHGGRVRRGEKGTAIFSWRPETDEDLRRRLDKQRSPEADSGSALLGHLNEAERRWIVSSHAVFNIEQCDGLAHLAPAPIPARTIIPIEQADAIIAAMPDCPPMREMGTRAYWTPATDEITLPPRALFRSDAAYYSTAFHELTHSTAHSSRVGRDIDGYSFSVHARTSEELIAEIGASFLRGEAGIESGDEDTNSTAYIVDWMSQIKADKTLVVRAAKAAQKAADYILNRPGVTASAPPENDGSLKQAA